MTRKLVSICFGLLVLTSCGGKKYGFTEGPFRMNARMGFIAEVGKPFVITLLLQGVIPTEPALLEILVDDEPVSASAGTVNPDRRVTQTSLTFGAGEYYSRLQPRGNLEQRRQNIRDWDAEDEGIDEVHVTISVRLTLAGGKRYHISRRVKLTCIECMA